MSTDTVIGVLGLLASVAGLIATVAIFYLGIFKKLDLIAKGLEGTLSRQQAIELSKLYLATVKSHLNDAYSRYEARSLREDYMQGNVPKIMYELQEIYKGVIQAVRPMFVSFRMRGNLHFHDLLAKFPKEYITKSFEEAAAMFEQAQKSSLPVDGIVPILRSKINDVGERGSELFLSKIEEIYPQRGEHDLSRF